MKEDTKKKIRSTLNMMGGFSDEVLKDFGGKSRGVIIKSPLEPEDEAVLEAGEKITKKAYNIHKEHSHRCLLCRYNAARLAELEDILGG